MEAKGDTESWFYLRARSIADGKPDPMPNVSELMGGKLRSGLKDSDAGQSS